MSFDLCTERKAIHPFYIAGIGVRIYTIEELCWFLYNNIYLIDDGVVSQKLVRWVRDELDMKKLSRRMAEALERPDHDISYFVLPVFQETGYLQPPEMHRIRRELTKAQVQPQEMRTKTKADYLVSAGRFSAAIAQYSGLLENSRRGNPGNVFYASVWNNLGCAYARQMRFREAAETFLKGFRQTQSRELMRRYVSTLPLYQTKEEYRATLKSTGADGVLIEKIQKYNASVAADVERKPAESAGKQQDPAKELERLKDEYRRGAQ